MLKVLREKQFGLFSACCQHHDLCQNCHQKDYPSCLVLNSGEFPNPTCSMTNYMSTCVQTCMRIFSSLHATRTLLAVSSTTCKKTFANNKNTPPQKNPTKPLLSIYERRNRANKPLDQRALIRRVTCHTMLKTTDGQLDERIH